MKNFKKRMAEREGFTLVELIVVIAILAILAAVAVPTYTGYIAKAESAADLQLLGNIATAAQGLAAAEGDEVSTITVATDGNGGITGITVTAEEGADVDASDLIFLLTGEANSTNYGSVGSFQSDEYANGATVDYSTSPASWTATTN